MLGNGKWFENSAKEQRLLCVRGFGGVGDSQGGANLGFYFHRYVIVLPQELACIILALTYFFSLVGVPGASFLDQLVLYTQLDDLPFSRDAFAIENIEFRLFEWRSNLVLDHLDARFAADYLIALFDGAGAAYIQSDRRVELQCVAAGRGFGVA